MPVKCVLLRRFGAHGEPNLYKNIYMPLSKVYLGSNADNSDCVFGHKHTLVYEVREVHDICAITDSFSL